MAWLRLALVWVVILLAFAIGVALSPILLIARVSTWISECVGDAGEAVADWCERMLERNYD